MSAKLLFTIGLVFAFAIGAYAGWGYKQVFGIPTPNPVASTTARFYAETIFPFSFVYPTRSNAIWLNTNSSFDYSTGIPTDTDGLVLSSRPTILPRLEVRIDDDATTTDFAFMTYIDSKYPSSADSAYGTDKHRTALAPYESTDHQFSGYFVSYEVGGMGSYSGQALVLKLNKACNSPNPSDCAYFTYTIDDISDMYTSNEFQKIADSITYVP